LLNIDHNLKLFKPFDIRSIKLPFTEYKSKLFDYTKESNSFDTKSIESPFRICKNHKPTLISKLLDDKKQFNFANTNFINSFFTKYKLNISNHKIESNFINTKFSKSPFSSIKLNILNIETSPQ
jgi:hypothetical protein